MVTRKEIEELMVAHLPEVAVLKTHVQASTMLVNGVMNQLRRMANEEATKLYRLVCAIDSQNNVEEHEAIRICFPEATPEVEHLVATVVLAAMRNRGCEMYLGCPYDFRESFADTGDIFDHDLWLRIIGLVSVISKEIAEIGEAEGHKQQILHFVFNNKVDPNAPLVPRRERISLTPDFQTTGALVLACNDGVPTSLLTPFGEVMFCVTTKKRNCFNPNGLNTTRYFMERMKAHKVDFERNRQITREDDVFYRVKSFGKVQLPQFWQRDEEDCFPGGTVQKVWDFHELLAREEEEQMFQEALAGNVCKLQNG